MRYDFERLKSKVLPKQRDHETRAKCVYPKRCLALFGGLKRLFLEGPNAA